MNSPKSYSTINANQLERLFKIRPNNGLKVVDLFSGCGGLSLGFKNAGFEILAAVDFDKDSLDTIKKNKLAQKAINLDLFDQNWIDKFKIEVDIENIDIVIAGPPCQGFSLTGPRNFSDKRNKLYKSVHELIEVAMPRAFLIENVKGMATLYGGKIREEVINEFTDLGYKVSSMILNAKNFGVPQSRERLFYIGMKEDFFEFPVAVFNEDDYITCKEAIDDLPSLEDLAEVYTHTSKPKSVYQNLVRGSVDKIYNHQPTRHTRDVIEVIKQVPEGGNHKDLPPGVGESRKFNEAWTRYHGDRPSKTIDTGHRNHFHYKYDRVPTIRENCRLQSFPDSFEILGSKTSQNKQVGNAVPVLLAKALAEAIYEQIEGN